MFTRKTSLLILYVLLFGGSLTLLFYQDKGEAFAPNPLKMRVLRAKDKTKQGPTAGEIKAFRDTSQKALAKSQEAVSPQPKPKRFLDDRIPKHVPIKIKIRKEKEKSFEDPDNEHWFRELEIEVKNTGTKPIYFLHLNVSMPEAIAPNGLIYGLPVYYGRPSLAPLSAPLKPEDMPIKPGGTCVLRISDWDATGWEGFAHEENKGHPQPIRIRVELQRINFGDGTGYDTTGGEPIPSPRKPGGAARCGPRPNREDPGNREFTWPLIALGPSSQRLPLTNLPASYLPANFLHADTDSLSIVASSITNPWCPCTGTSCTFVDNSVKTRCYCSDITTTEPDIPDFAIVDNCNDPRGECRLIGSETKRCSFPGLQFPLFCTIPTFQACGTAPEEPTPTPSPTPSPSPSPSPSCPANTKPNDVNCKCVYIQGGETGWDCSCPEGSFYADNKNFPGNYGCPGNSHYGTNGCCTCVQTDHTCQEGCLWVEALCGCYSQSGPCSTVAVMQPGSATGGGEGHEPGDEIETCDNYYWVWFSSSDGGQTWTPTGQVDFAGCY